ncbi:MAG: hypothetical protein ABIV51_12490 [Saprospiraceae bacterium]
MTKEDFLKTQFGAGDKVQVLGITYPICSVDFEEETIGVLGEDGMKFFEVHFRYCKFISFDTKVAS